MNETLLKTIGRPAVIVGLVVAFTALVAAIWIPTGQWPQQQLVLTGILVGAVALFGAPFAFI